MDVTIIVDENPDPDGREAILDPLRRFNISKAGDLPYGNVAIYLRNAQNETNVGGLWGRIAARWLFIELLFIPESLRGVGLGSSLIERAEALARKSGCVGVWLDTFSFQAPDFYKSLGYKCFGELPNYPNDHSRYFFFKTL